MAPGGSEVEPPSEPACDRADGPATDALPGGGLAQDGAAAAVQQVEPPSEPACDRAARDPQGQRDDFTPDLPAGVEPEHVGDEAIPASQDECAPAPHARFGYRFRNKLSVEVADAGADPLLGCLRALRAVTDIEPFEEAVHHSNLFTGFQAESDAFQTTLNELISIADDDRSHRDLCCDQAFALRKLMPLPFSRAVSAVALREGWQDECLYQELEVCGSFCEHAATRLKVRVGDTHGRIPGIAGLTLADASARKTSLDEQGTRWLIGRPNSPAAWKPHEIIASDGTIAGVRGAILEHGAVAIISSEVSTTYKTPYSDPEVKGRHYHSRAKMCVFLSGEMDDALTAHGGRHMACYRTCHKVKGHFEAIERLMAPSVRGFHKRIDMTVSGDEPACNPTAGCSASSAFLEECLDFLLKTCGPLPCGQSSRW